MGCKSYICITSFTCISTVPFQTKIFPSVPWSRMKQSSVFRAAWEKGFSSATRETAMFPAPFETYDNTAQRLDKAFPFFPPASWQWSKTQGVEGNQFECIGCSRHYCFSNRIPLIQQHYDKSITLTLKLSSTSSNTDNAGTKLRLIQNSKYLWCKTSPYIFLKQNICT